MADSIRTQIVDNIKAALENITIANGYNEDVISVHSDSFDSPESFNEFPQLFIIDTDEDMEPLDVDSTQNTLTLIVTGYCKSQNDMDNVQDKRRKLQADVQKALMVDERRNMLALSTDVIRVITDKGTLEPYSIFDLTVQVVYYTNKYDPYVVS